MSVLLFVGPKFTLAALHAAPGEYADGPDRQTDGRTGARPLHYAFCYGHGQRNKVSP